MATFNMIKGSKFSLAKGIKKVVVGLGWDVAKGRENGFDVDASMYGCVRDGGGVPHFFNDGSHALCYANKSIHQGPGKAFSADDGSLTHTGDERTGASAGDDEQMLVDFDKLPNEIDEILVFITIYESLKRKQNFGMISNSYVRVVDQDTNDELCKYDLKNQFSDSLSIQVGSFVKENGAWSFKAIGVGSPTEEMGQILEKLS